MSKVVVVNGVRTAFGKFGGSLRDVSTTDLGAFVNGGAIAIGHPIGASGARIIMTMIYELRRRGGGYGVAAICGGLSQGDACVVRV